MTEADAKQRDRVRFRALSDEVDAVSTLLRHGFNILRAYRYATRDADAVFVCLAGGTEKLLKLTVGLYELDTSGSWPSKQVMQGKYGHDIVKLDHEVRKLIDDHRQRSTAPGYIVQLLRSVSDDPYIELIFEAFGRYAVQGRSYNLDMLADAPQPKPSPTQLWEELHQNLLERRPDLLSALASPEWEQGRSQLNLLIVASISQWYELIARAWMTGVIGQQAKLWTGQLAIGPDGL